LGTIYRTLDILRSIGLVQVFSHAGGAAKYEATLEKHHHLVCTNCGEVVNVAVNEALPLAQALAQDHGFDGVDCALVVTGRCPRCARPNGVAN
jgi:Fe2+ or Zn2+ uptake regulation protein